MKYLFALFLALASFGTALADSRDTTLTTVPFDFVIGSRTFPAGKYIINRVSDDPLQGLHIQSSDGKISGFFLPTTSDATGSNDQTKLQFRHEGDEYFLTAIVSEFNTYTLNPNRHHPRTAEPENTVTVGNP
jgi:hypothetical protein